LSQNILSAQEMNLVASNDNPAEKPIVIKKENTENKTEDTNIERVNFEIKNNSAFYNNGINYNLTSPGFVSIKLMDREGNEVASLVNQEQNPGNYYTQFSTFNLASGIYQYKIMLNEKEYLKRMIILN
jgi:hypothetical protein